MSGTLDELHGEVPGRAFRPLRRHSRTWAHPCSLRYLRQRDTSPKRSHVKPPVAFRAVGAWVMALIPFDEVGRRLGLAQRSYVGLREIPVDRIVGSVDRSGDFDRGFRPRRPFSRARLAGLREASRAGALPPIVV